MIERSDVKSINGVTALARIPIVSIQIEIKMGMLFWNDDGLTRWQDSLSDPTFWLKIGRDCGSRIVCCSVVDSLEPLWYVPNQLLSSKSKRKFATEFGRNIGSRLMKIATEKADITKM
jgi:hypothetical protein